MHGRYEISLSFFFLTPLLSEELHPSFSFYLSIFSSRAEGLRLLLLSSSLGKRGKMRKRGDEDGEAVNGMTSTLPYKVRKKKPGGKGGL